MLSPGVVLNNRYRLTDRVGAGGMGEVWSAVDTLLNRKVAVKVLLPELVSDTEFITRFRAEARSMAALRHPGIAEVYDYAENVTVDGDRVDYFVMAYVEGVSLTRRIGTAGLPPVEETLSVVTQAALALHAAHQANIIHRDVKPSNLLIQADCTVVLVDFGVARSAAITGLTGSNVVLGTPDYIAPEQISGDPVSAATDIYALGAVMYCCLTGRPPFTGTNPLQVVSKHLKDAPPALPPDVPAPVAALVTRALAKDPGDRFPSAAAFADAARAAAGSTPLPGLPELSTGPTVDLGWNAAPQADPRPAAARNRHRTGIVAGLAGVLAVALVGLVAILALRPQDRPPAAGRLEQAGGETLTSSAPAATAEPAREAVEPARTPADPQESARTPAGSRPSPTAQRTAGAPTPGNPKASTTPPGPPATNPYTPTQVCGSGYQVIDSATLTGGRVYLLYDISSGNNCVVTMKTASVGTKTAASAYLEVKGRARSTDNGSFAYYAGPVRAAAAGVCVKWGGTVGTASYGSAFEHCD